MYAEEDYVPLSALQHLAFCERRCALIYLEGQWEDNQSTAQGAEFHQQAHEAGVESRGEVRLVRGLMLSSARLGLSGKTDLVEFHRCPEGSADDPRPPPGVAILGWSGRWQPYPVEYKVGRPQPDLCYHVQLCAQALCLEEMLGACVPQGALFFGRPRRRERVCLDAALRQETERLATRLQELLAAGLTPPAQWAKHCSGCSLLPVCLPRSAGARRSARHYLQRALGELLDGEGDP